MPLNGATFYQRGQNSSHTMVASYYLETVSGGRYELVIKIRFTDMMTLLPKKIDIRLQALLLMKVKARKFVSHTMAQSSIIIVIPTISFS